MLSLVLHKFTIPDQQNHKILFSCLFRWYDGIRTITRMDTIPNGHHPEWTLSRMDTIPNGHHPEWTPSPKDTIPNVHNPNGHNPECALTCIYSYLSLVCMLGKDFLKMRFE